MLDQKVAGLLNEQVNKEFYSAYLYLDFSNFYKSRSLDGYANWYEIQAREEMDHAMMMIRYLQDNDHEVGPSTSRSARWKAPRIRCMPVWSMSAM